MLYFLAKEKFEKRRNGNARRKKIQKSKEKSGWAPRERAGSRFFLLLHVQRGWFAALAGGKWRKERESERQGWMRGDVTRHAARAAETPGLSRCMRGDSWRNDHHQSNLAEINRYPRARVSDINTTHTHCVAFRFLQIISRRSHTYSHSSDFDACVFIVFLLRRENSTR